jgi:hypothetical protein
LLFVRANELADYAYLVARRSFIDTDEYLVPMKHTTWTDLLDDMESKNIEVLKMRSSRGLPRHHLMQ